jgi:hypothetical protein
MVLLLLLVLMVLRGLHVVLNIAALDDAQLDIFRPGRQDTSLMKLSHRREEGSCCLLWKWHAAY